jgi:magnesium transporter
MIGVVTQDDALKIVEQEASEDLLKFSGIVGGEETRDMPFLRRSSRRLAWLSVNILLNLVAASIIWAHEDTIMAVIGIAMFLPIISDMSGCSGNQAIAVSIRELAMDLIAPRDFLRIWWKEASVGLLNGFVLGAQLGGIAYLWKGRLDLALVVGLALWLNTILSLTIGSLVPLLLKKMKKDPALASAPILTTLTDLCGFYLVLTLAAEFLQ